MSLDAKLNNCPSPSCDRISLFPQLVHTIEGTTESNMDRFYQIQKQIGEIQYICNTQSKTYFQSMFFVCCAVLRSVMFYVYAKYGISPIKIHVLQERI